jgi:hypothetical protein
MTLPPDNSNGLFSLCDPMDCIEEVRRGSGTEFEKTERLFLRGYREIQRILVEANALMQQRLSLALEDSAKVWQALKDHIEHEERQQALETALAADAAVKLAAHHKAVEDRLHSIESLVDRGRGVVTAVAIFGGLLGVVGGGIAMISGLIQIGKHFGWW